MKRVLFLLLVLTALPLTGWDLDAITVTGTRTSERLAESPIVTEILTEKEIRQTGASNLAEVLAAYGVISDGDTSHGDASTLQGLGGARVLVLIDGRRVVGRVAQNLDGAGLPLVNVDRIEIVRGPQSALYGSDAMGGVINIITKTPGEKITGTAQLDNLSIPSQLHVFQTQRGSASINLPLGPVLTTVSASGSRSVFYYDKLGEVSILPRSLVGKAAIDNVFELGPGRSTLGLSATLLREEDQTDFTKSLSRKDLQRAEVYGSWKVLLADGASFEAKAYNHWYGRELSTYSGGTSLWTGTDPERENLTGAEAWYTADLSDSNTLTVGLESSWSLIHDSDLSLDGEWGLQDRQALILQDEQSGEEDYSVVGGLRIERGRFGLFAAPKISAMYRPIQNLRLLAGTGVGYRAPSNEDLYYDIDWSWHPIVLGNRNLTPEYSLAANLGAEWTEKLLSSRINAYHQELFDEIVFVESGTAADGRALYQNQNKSRTSRTGFDTEVSATWNLLTAEASYGYVLGWDRDENLAIDTLAAHQLRSALAAAWAPWGLSARVQSQWESLRGHIVIGASVTQDWGGGFEASVRAENLTNVIDPAHGPFAPTTVTVGIRFKT